MAAQRQDNVFIVLEVVGVVLLLDQATLLLPEILPVSLGQASWRYGVFGLLIGRATPILFADVLILFAAYRLGQARFLRLAGLLHLVIAVAILLGLGLFGLDAVQVRRQLKPEFQGGLLVSAGRAMLMTLLLSAFGIWAGLRLLADGGSLSGGAASGRREGKFLITQETDATTPKSE